MKKLKPPFQISITADHKIYVVLIVSCDRLIHIQRCLTKLVLDVRLPH